MNTKKLFISTILLLLVLILVLILGKVTAKEVKIVVTSTKVFTTIARTQEAFLESSKTPLPVPSLTETPILTPTSELDIGNPIPEQADDGNTYNGYWWDGEGWVPGLVTFDTQFLRLPPVSMGSAVFYAPYVMNANIEYRELSYDTEKYVGAVSVQFCSEIGHSVWIKIPSASEWEGPFLVADCSRRNDLYQQIMFRDQVVEVDFNTAVRWNMARMSTTNAQGWIALNGRMDGVLVSVLPPEEYDGNITDLSVWFLKHVKYAEISENRFQIRNYVPPSYDGMGYHGYGFINPSDTLPMWLIRDEWVQFP